MRRPGEKLPAQMTHHHLTTRTIILHSSVEKGPSRPPHPPQRLGAHFCVMMGFSTTRTAGRRILAEVVLSPSQDCAPALLSSVPFFCGCPLFGRVSPHVFAAFHRATFVGARKNADHRGYIAGLSLLLALPRRSTASFGYVAL